jgi:hypothetical protein
LTFCGFLWDALCQRPTIILTLLKQTKNNLEKVRCQLHFEQVSMPI